MNSSPSSGNAMSEDHDHDHAKDDYENILRQANAYYKQQNYDGAGQLAAQAVQMRPDEDGPRRTLAMCQVHTEQFGEAIVNFRWLSNRYPAGYEDTYRLGCLLQHQGAYREATEAFRQVLAVIDDFRDTRVRLSECERGVGDAPAAWTQNTRIIPRIDTPPANDYSSGAVGAAGPLVAGRVPGPEPVKKVVEKDYIADRGAAITTIAGNSHVTQKTRYLIPVIGKATVEAIGVSLLPVIASIVVNHLSASLQIYLHHLSPALTTALRWGVPLLLLTMWVRVLAKAIPILVQSRLYGVTFYERGFDIATGVFRRHKQFLWYYQLTEEPRYVRTPMMFLTHTASLQIKYNDAATTVKDLELSGIGSPREVEEIRMYIESRRLAERSPMRGFLT